MNNRDEQQKKLDQILAALETINRGQVKSGMILLDASNELPKNYALCDGQELSREQYPHLWESIGTKFGDGDGHSTFNLPLLESPFPNLRYVIFLG